METIILASGSPRRKELISLLPWPFKVATKEVDETLDELLSVEENVQALALKKAEAVAKDYEEQFVVGADTMVCLEGKLLGKPHSKEEAFEMLKLLSGKSHQVLSGVAVICKSKGTQKVFCEATTVRMQPLSDEEINAYIETNEPMDKAGSYAIQGYGGKYIEGIEGDFFNVVGLPLHRLYEILKQEIK